MTKDEFYARAVLAIAQATNLDPHTVVLRAKALTAEWKKSRPKEDTTVTMKPIVTRAQLAEFWHQRMTGNRIFNAAYESTTFDSLC